MPATFSRLLNLAALLSLLAEGAFWLCRGEALAEHPKEAREIVPHYMWLAYAFAILPVMWGISKLFRSRRPRPPPSYEDKLRQRYRFLLPTPIAVYIMVALFVMSFDLAATAGSAQEGAVGFFWLACVEIALFYNILARRRLAVRLHRISMNMCEMCGYDLRASPGRCPECGNATR
ncbi:MAG TPA: hypothetical protein VFC78_25010 [Tepidisphaeraceae bacterium]|nr:hypothetical protein [Tepidisphaeraceae bacterium]